ncbi:MAG TPA: BMP family ABC transporter substrate-binding protein [Conexibacter sp.]|nr:BMP family ABC transporter substrate-binding protein [Conexibacter sp.]
MSRWLGAIALALPLIAVGAGCGGSSSGGSTSSSSASQSSGGSGTLKVAFVYSAAAQDGGWNAAMELGRQALVRHFAGKVQTTVKENVPDGPQDQQVLNGLIQDGYKVIVATSFGQQKYTYQLAQQHPDVKFLQVEGLKPMPNVTNFDANGSDGFYIAGMAAAASAKGDMLGIVGGFPLSTQLAQVNAFELGAQKVNPAAKTKVIWTNDWYSLSKAQDAGQALVSSGVKALTLFTTGPGIAPVAKSTNTPWIGFEVDQSGYAPQQYVTGVTFNWAPFFIDNIQQILGGTWKANPNDYAGLSDGVVQIQPQWGHAFAGAASVKGKIQQAIDGLRNDTAYVFAGPLKDRSGKLRIPAGKHASDVDIETMNYVVPGVVGVIPGMG